MKERKLVREFTLDTEIYDTELPQKVLFALQVEPLETNPCLYYGMDVVFDKAVYQTREFFQYPLEKMLPSPPNRRGKMTEQTQLHERLSSILSQQLSQVSSSVKDAGIALSNTAIIGDDLNQLHQVTFKFFEEKEKEYDKKGRLKQIGIVNSIMPDRPYILEKAAKFFAEMAMKHIEEEIRKERDQTAHTPHMVPAGELFTAAAKAILLDHRRKTEEEITALAEQLRLHAEIQSDWPLEIVSAKNPEKPFAADTEIDCPEFLLYHENAYGKWTLKKVENLSAAQFQITKHGYSQKSTVRMAVLHNLRPLGFSLFSETAEGLVKVKKQEAFKAKNLNLSWKK